MQGSYICSYTSIISTNYMHVAMYVYIYIYMQLYLLKLIILYTFSLACNPSILQHNVET